MVKSSQIKKKVKTTPKQRKVALMYIEGENKADIGRAVGNIGANGGSVTRRQESKTASAIADRILQQEGTQREIQRITESRKDALEYIRRNHIDDYENSKKMAEEHARELSVSGIKSLENFGRTFGAYSDVMLNVNAEAKIEDVMVDFSEVSDGQDEEMAQ